jgi:hypothetical protein
MAMDAFEVERDDANKEEALYLALKSQLERVRSSRDCHSPDGREVIGQNLFQTSPRYHTRSQTFSEMVGEDRNHCAISASSDMAVEETPPAVDRVTTPAVVVDSGKPIQLNHASKYESLDEQQFKKLCKKKKVVGSVEIIVFSNCRMT